MKKICFSALALLAAIVGFTGLAIARPLTAGLLPDLRTVVPQHLGIMNEHQRDILRFSNGVANTGDGDWRMRPEFTLADPTQSQKAIQEILDANGNVVAKKE